MATLSNFIEFIQCSFRYLSGETLNTLRYTDAGKEYPFSGIILPKSNFYDVSHHKDVDKVLIAVAAYGSEDAPFTLIMIGVKVKATGKMEVITGATYNFGDRVPPDQISYIECIQQQLKNKYVSALSKDYQDFIHELLSAANINNGIITGKQLITLPETREKLAYYKMRNDTIPFNNLTPVPNHLKFHGVIFEKNEIKNIGEKADLTDGLLFIGMDNTQKYNIIIGGLKSGYTLDPDNIYVSSMEFFPDDVDGYYQ